ncbi:MAG: hypothetical protein RJA25_848 [Bacteroidota bacterium]|jgi:hypothetical protein
MLIKNTKRRSVLFIFDKLRRIPFYKWIIYYLIIFGITQNIDAQNFVRFDYLPVSQNGILLTNPWTGGINSVQFGKADINHDGKNDLILFDKYNKQFLPFLSTENSSTNYIFNLQYASCFPPARGWIIMKDYNCDGIEDIFTYNGIGNLIVYIGYYENDTLKYKLQQNGLYYQGVSGKINVYCSEVIKPALADINQDGDLDIISFNVTGDRIIYYENQQKELGLSCDSLFFAKTDNCWGNVRDPLDAAFILKDTCGYKFTRLNGNENIEHTGSYIDAFDMDKNGAVDLVIGSVSLNNLTALYNNGNKNYASILQQDINFPIDATTFNVSTFGTPAFIDVDNDNVVDLLVSTFDNGAANINNIWYYENTQTNPTQKIKLELKQKNFLLDNMIDAGENSNPCFFDVDGDGLTDILLGSGGFKDYVNPSVYKLLFYKNIGTPTQPAFNLENDDFLNISALGLIDIVPTVGDIDNDNDLDLAIGTSDGRIAYWENTATLGNPPNLVYRGFLKDNNSNEISIGLNAAPCLIDIDKDGKTDLIIGERNGNLNFYKGSSTNNIKLAYITDSLGKIFIKTNSIAIGYTQPTIADVNKDGKYDLILGTNTNGLLFYDNIEDKLTTNFILSPTLINYTNGRTTSTFADINNDNKPELLIGNINGGLIIYSENPPPYIPTALHHNSSTLDVKIFPNPTQNNLYIQLKEISKEIQVQIINIFGQNVFTQKYYLQNNIELNTTNFINGIYLLKITDGEKENVLKFVIQY